MNIYERVIVMRNYNILLTVEKKFEKIFENLKYFS